MAEKPQPLRKRASIKPDGTVLLDASELVRLLSDAGTEIDLVLLKGRVADLKKTIIASHGNGAGLVLGEAVPGSLELKRDVLVADLDQILEARSIERAKYYLRRLERGALETKTTGINDINLARWKEYTDVITDSLWMLPRRDGSGAHLGWYWGNFIPQIPNQLMRRYTKRGDWVLDPFLGSGTTLIECRRLGRNGLGVELSSEVSAKAGNLIDRERNSYSVKTSVLIGDARRLDLEGALAGFGVSSVQLLILHPPYHDIIRFSGDESDLSNAGGVGQFLEMFGDVLDNVTGVLESGRHMCLVIGDKYVKGEWIPLGFRCMEEVLKRRYVLKSIVVKNFEDTRAKREQKQLWRYRALAGGFYIFKHEYIFVFKKVGR